MSFFSRPILIISRSVLVVVCRTIISGYNLPTDSNMYALLYGHMWNDFGRGFQDHVLVLDDGYFIYDSMMFDAMSSMSFTCRIAQFSGYYSIRNG